MNIKLCQAVLTDPKGEIFRDIREVYIRGNVVKYFTLEEHAIKKIQGTEYKAPEKFEDRRDGRKKKGEWKEEKRQKRV